MIQENLSSEEKEPKIQEPQVEEVQEAKSSEGDFSFLNEAKTGEEKCRLLLDFMENALSGSKPPRFKAFWDAQKELNVHLKNVRDPQQKNEISAKSGELIRQAKQLKQLLQEESSFAVEQIEIAIEALKKEIEEPELHFTSNMVVAALPQYLLKREDEYLPIQRELLFLQTQATRIQSLREELIKTEMRIRQKNKFFQILSKLGDIVFPEKKERARIMSTMFAEDVAAFFEEHFSEGRAKERLFYLREEIKAFQAVAKELPLLTSTFTEVRKYLSQAWDILKNWEKARKNEHAQKKQIWMQAHEEALQKLEVLKEEIASLDAPSLLKKCDDFTHSLRKMDLSREQVQELKDHIQELKKPAEDLLKQEEEERRRLQKEKETQRQERLQGMKDRLRGASKDMAIEELKAVREELQQFIAKENILKFEKIELDRLNQSLSDLLHEKEEHALMQLSDDARQDLEQLQQVLRQRRQRRQEIKQQLRKQSSTTGFDIEKAMRAHEEMQEERTRLEKIEEGIVEIEEKISSLKKSVTSKNSA